MAVAHYLEALAWQRDAARLHAIFGGKNPHPNFVVGGVRLPHRPQLRLGHQRQEARRGADRHRLHAPVRGPGLCPGHPGHRRLLQGLGRARRGARQLPVLRRPAREGHDWTRRASCSRAGPSSTATSSPSTRSTCTTTARSRSSSPIPGTTTPGARRPGPAPLRRRDQPRLRRARRGQAPLHPARRGGRLLLAQVATLEGPLDGGRPPGPGAVALCGHRGRRPRPDQGAGGHDPHASSICRSRPCSPPWGAPPPAPWRPRSSSTPCRSGTTTWSPTSRPATPRPSTRPSGIPPPGPSRPRARASWRPRAGALGHWIVIKDGHIDNYQAVVPSTWNAGPRDPKAPGRGLRGGPAGQPPARRRQAAGGDPAHHPLLRPLHRLRRPPLRPRDRRADRDQGHLDEANRGARQRRLDFGEDKGRASGPCFCGQGKDPATSLASPRPDQSRPPAWPSGCYVGERRPALRARTAWV